MGTYIKSISVNLFNGIFLETLAFNPGLNIFAGENGTCKTNLLKLLKSQTNIVIENLNPSNPFKIQAISPKRNSERKNIETIIQQFRTQNKTYDNFINEIINKQLNDNTFDNYPSFGELFYWSFDKLCKQGGELMEYMNLATNDFNKVIKCIFDNYELVSEWNLNTGTPTIKLRKNYDQDIPLVALSCGEQEILSLVLNLYTSKDSVNLFLIDEPEVHLNWNLEEKLFEYLNEFCETYQKQVIVSTHSRVIFKDQFLPKTQFLYWDTGKIKCTSNVPDEHRKKIAGEAIEIIKLGEFSKPTFFVEDHIHKEVLEKMADLMGKEISVSVAGNSSNVKSLYKLSKKEGGWNNSYFLIDGNNQGNPFPDEVNFIHLDKYCIENYLIDIDTISLMTSKTKDEIKELLFDLIIDNKETIFKKNKFFEFLIDRLNKEDIADEALRKLDASLIFEPFLKKIEASKSSYIYDYIKVNRENGKLKSIFPEKITDIIEQG